MAAYDNGRINLEDLAARILVYVEEATSGRGELYETVRDLTDELERHHDLRTSPWNSPEDVGPEDERELREVLDHVRALIEDRSTG
ncbi:hypothetical protein [Streptomyces antibioticus]|uniref:Uncharacterized protein n=1 Tax=Streptomyces antibioticus TaxID=1890 RepID=A0AAE6Y339_STRAT|nr:hypothetical protein [Streptomyces antibioticus]OOQ54405.1 hypothetical protein AFM16_05155 [Streptomyces antibioticus]QIT42146.1 hypothetical protein HCX60_00165 [Streptomyces antibioticus]